jgi:hypothetical protein
VTVRATDSPDSYRDSGYLVRQPNKKMSNVGALSSHAV